MHLRHRVCPQERNFDLCWSLSYESRQTQQVDKSSVSSSNKVAIVSNFSYVIKQVLPYKFIKFIMNLTDITLILRERTNEKSSSRNETTR